MTPRQKAQQLLATLYNDQDRLQLIDRYIHGQHDAPYIPDSADDELKSLLRRATLNLLDHAIEAPADLLWVDSVRPGRKVDPKAPLPEWEHWQASRCDSRQRAIHEAAIGYGHSFTVTESRQGRVLTRGLSPLSTSAIFADPANDDTPLAALTVEEWPGKTNGGTGLARMWDSTTEYEVLFQHLGDTERLVVEEVGPHGATSCPVTRFAAKVDLDGRTLGVVEPLITLQDRINQTVFDTLVLQTGGAFKVKVASNMAPPYKMRYEIDQDGSKRLVPVLDEDGAPVLDKIRISPAMFLWAEGDAKFDTLDETPLDGYLKAVGEAIRQFSAKSRTPPHYMLGEIANLSAEALQAAETALERRAGGFRQVFGESWERVFRLAAELGGIAGAADDHKTEVIWRDMEARAMSKTADGLLKLRQLGAPKRGLFQLIPGMTKTMLDEWEDFLEEEDSQAKLASAIAGANPAAGMRRQMAQQGAQQPTDPAEAA